MVAVNLLIGKSQVISGQCLSKIMQNIIINSYDFSNQNKTNVIGKIDNVMLKGYLRIIEEEPKVQVKWGRKVLVPENTPFRIKHPVFKNITYIFENIKVENIERKVTFLEYLLSLHNIIK